MRATLLVLVMLASVLAAGCGSKSTGDTPPIKSAGVLRIGTEGTYSPFSYHDPPETGELTGYDVDVAKAVGDKLGVKVEFVETPWDSIFAGLAADRFDVVANEVTINGAPSQIRSVAAIFGGRRRYRHARRGMTPSPRWPT